MDADDNFPQAFKDGSLAVMQDYCLRRVLYGGLEGQRHDEALQLLCDVCPPDPPEDWNPRPYINSQSWRTSRDGTHSYVMLMRSTAWREHLVFIRWLRVWGRLEKFRGSRYPYIEIDGFRYWAMSELSHTIANRRVAPGAASPTLGLWDE